MQASFERPRFRLDLVAEPIDDGATRFIDVMDPDSGNLFRFYEVEYALACGMDGQRDVGGIVKWAKDELGLSPSATEVQTVIATLGELGYLESGAAEAAAAKPEAAAAVRAPAAASKSGPASSPAYNRWDQPTATGSLDDYVRSQANGAGDVELGHAGTTAAAASSELPKAPDLELGAPGAPAAAPGRDALPKADDLSLGASGRGQASEVSIDLSKHVDVKRDDVKEAVRASQVMKAVDVPPELLAEAEGKKPAPEAKPPTRPTPPSEAKAADAKATEAKPADAKADKAKPAAAKAADVAADKAKPADAKAAKAKPEPTAKPPVEQPRPVAPTAPRAGVSPALIAILVLVILAGVGFYAWKYVMNKPAPEPTSTQPAAPPPPPPPAPPPPESTKLASEQPAAVDLKAKNAGVIEKIVASDASVKAGDVVAWLVGEKPHDTQVKAIQADLDKRLQPELERAQKQREAAQAAGNKAGLTAAERQVAARQKALDDKVAELAKLQAVLDKYLVKAPGDGTVAVVAKAQQKITPNDVIAKLTPPALLVATFKQAGALEAGQHVLLQVKGGEQKLSCTVVEASEDHSKISCPHDAAAEGTEVIFAGPDTSAAPAQGSDAGGSAGSGAAGIEMDDGSTGSAAATPAPAPAPVHHAAAPHVHHHAAHIPAHVATPPDKAAVAPADKPVEDKPAAADKAAEAPAAPAADTTGSAAPLH